MSTCLRTIGVNKTCKTYLGRERTIFFLLRRQQATNTKTVTTEIIRSPIGTDIYTYNSGLMLRSEIGVGMVEGKGVVVDISIQLVSLSR